jgi:hypothetical protein
LRTACTPPDPSQAAHCTCLNGNGHAALEGSDAELSVGSLFLHLSKSETRVVKGVSPFDKMRDTPG